MRKVIVSEFLTVDGVMQAPGGSDEDREAGFEHGGWQMPYFDDVAGAAVGEGFQSAGGLLLGRKTYDIFAGYWPNQPADDPFVATMNGLPKFVASRTLEEPLKWENSTLLKGDVAQAVAKLKEESGGHLQVVGSGDFAQTLIREGLVDEYALLVHPLLLGTGKRLFRDGNPRTPLKLVDSKTSTTGTVILTYRPAETEAEG
jgi:dihydrofolate reductase